MVKLYTMDSKKKQQYIYIGMVPILVILSYFHINSFLNILTGIRNFTAIQITTLLSNSIQQLSHTIPLGKLNINNITLSLPRLSFTYITDNQHINNYTDLLLNSFISGIFYGMSFLCLIASFIVYKIFKEKKWILYLAIQSLILLCFVNTDILTILDLDISIINSILRTTILASSIILLGMLVSTYYTLRAKRFMYKNELKIYSITSIIALVLYYSSYIYGEGHILLLDITVVSLFIITNMLSKVLKRRSKYYLYVIFILCLCVLYGICFTNMEIRQSLTDYNQSMNYLKLLVIIIIIFSITNNYVLIRKNQKHNVRNRVFMFQYVLMLKNYHKLLVNEKNSQTVKQNDITSLKEHKGNLSYYLKDNYKLTEREINVLYLIWDGLTNKEIAHELSITISTTKYHISNIYLKLNVNSRSQVFALKDW